MHELVIVLSDLYLSQESPERELPARVSLPGLQHAARFGARSKIIGGWRSWLARWLTGRDAGRPAPVAALAVSVVPSALLSAAPLQPSRAGPAAAGVPPSSVVQSAPVSSQSPSDARPLIAWMATPVHLIAGLTSVHVDRRSILRLDANDQAALAADFQRVFHDSGFQLRPLGSGDFLMLGPQMPIAETPEPARVLGASVADAQRADAANPALRRLGAEIEMWLHDHAVNDNRSRRGQPPVTALWLWGGGPIADVTADARNPGDADEGGDGHRSGTARATTDIAFGRDAYLQGLWAARGTKVFPLPQQLADVFGYPRAQRTVLVIEIGLMLQCHPTWTFFDAMAQIDRSFIAPAIEALNQGQCEPLVILANDYQLRVHARDRLKFWRRTPPGLSGLQ